MSEADWLQIALITVEVMLSVLAIMIALAALLGFNWINKKAEKTAQKTAQKTINKFLEESNIKFLEESNIKFLKESNIKDMIESYVRTEANQIYEEIKRSPKHDLNELREKETNND